MDRQIRQTHPSTLTEPNLMSTLANICNGVQKPRSRPPKRTFGLGALGLEKTIFTKSTFNLSCYQFKSILVDIWNGVYSVSLRLYVSAESHMIKMAFMCLQTVIWIAKHNKPILQP